MSNYFTFLHQNLDSNPLQDFILDVIESFLEQTLNAPPATIMKIGSFLEPVIYSIGLLADLYLAAEVTFFRVIVPFCYLYGSEIALSCIELFRRDKQTQLEYTLKGLLFVHDLSDDVTIASVLGDKEGIKFLCNFNFRESMEEDFLD